VSFIQLLKNSFELWRENTILKISRLLNEGEPTVYQGKWGHSLEKRIDK